MSKVFKTRVLIHSLTLLFLLVTANSHANLNIIGNIIILSPEQNIKNIIENGTLGDTFIFKGERYFIEGNIHVPSGVTIEGTLKTSLVQVKSKIKKPFFNILDKSDITLRNFSMELYAGESGIVAVQSVGLLKNYTEHFKEIEEGSIEDKNFKESNNIKLDHLNIIGHLDAQMVLAEDQSLTGILIRNVNNLNISAVNISNTVGGIYVSGDKIRIKNNKLTQVNLGNIVVSGKDIEIINNVVNESGKGTDFGPGHGDSITIGAGSSDLIIKDNIFDTGYCYIIWAHGVVTNLKILNNIIKSSITTGIMIDTGYNVLIANNSFISNLAYGLAIIQSGENISIENNKFYSNALLISTKILHVMVKNNTFDAIPYGTNVLKVGKNVELINNTINYLSESSSPQIVVTTNTGINIEMGDVIELDSFVSNFITFKILNIGNQSINIWGQPQVQLTREVLSETDRGKNQSGASIFDGFKIGALDQPHKLTLLPNESTEFTIRANVGDQDHHGELVTVNIPTLFKSYRPFWFKIKLV